MKQLILFLFFLPLYADAIQEMSELSNTAIKNQLVARIKDIEVQNMLEETKEFKDCKEPNKFLASDGPAQKETKLKAAEACFRKELASKNDPEKLKKLSENLGLESYGLIKSKNVNEISEYLGDKMYESMTGVDRKEKNFQALMDSLKFNKRKIPDQKTFVLLYKNQLTKNAIFESSRFCFENLRLASPPASSPKDFTGYWKSYIETEVANAQNPNAGFDLAKLTDTGSKADRFGDFSDVTNKDAVYGDLFKSIAGSGNVNGEFLGQFFGICVNAMKPLCDAFTPPAADPSTPSTSPTMTRGANACLALDRLREIRKAIVNTDKTIKQFNDELSSGRAVKLDEGLPQMFKDDEALDELTNFSSTDMLAQGSMDVDNKTKECEANPELGKCDAFLTDAEAQMKSEHHIDMELRLKKEVERKRVLALKAEGGKKLTEYLEENGYLELANKDPQQITEQDLTKAIDTAFDGKRTAIIEGLRSKLGSRQTTNNPGQDENNDKNLVKERAQDSKEERARLAQVVMFNNIVSSHLILYKDMGNDKLERVGRNLGAWKKEEQGLTKAGIKDEYFQNLRESAQTAAQESSGSSAGTEMGGLQLIDSILKKPDQSASTVP